MAPKEWIDEFKGQFDVCWERYREMTLERKKKLGVILAETQAYFPAFNSACVG